MNKEMAKLGSGFISDYCDYCNCYDHGTYVLIDDVWKFLCKKCLCKEQNKEVMKK